MAGGFVYNAIDQTEVATAEVYGKALADIILKDPKVVAITADLAKSTKLGDVLIEPTRIYVKALKAAKDAGVELKACSHVTGGGFYENVPRMLKEGTRAVIRKDSYPVPAIILLLFFQHTSIISAKIRNNLFLFCFF